MKLYQPFSLYSLLFVIYLYVSEQSWDKTLRILSVRGPPRSGLSLVHARRRPAGPGRADTRAGRASLVLELERRRSGVTLSFHWLPIHQGSVNRCEGRQQHRKEQGPATEPPLHGHHSSTSRLWTLGDLCSSSAPNFPLLRSSTALRSNQLRSTSKACTCKGTLWKFWGCTVASFT